MYLLEQVLDDIIVLRVENGQDFFISVKGNYARSCFGLFYISLTMDDNQQECL